MIHRRLHPLMIMMLLVGCAVGPDYQQPAPPATTHWNDKGDSAVKSQTSSAATNPRWWKTFGSPQLDSLIERAIAGNLTLQQTVLRIAGAREQINQSRRGVFPVGEWQCAGDATAAWAGRGAEIPRRVRPVE